MPAVGPLILMASCEAYRHNGVNDAARRTWIERWGADVSYKFVLGRECNNPAEDELIVDASDAYEGLSYKVRAARAWASANGFDYTFHCGTDTYVVVPRLLESGFEHSDYSGYLIHDEHRLYAPRNIQFAQGGGGYWLSAFAGGFVEKAALPEWNSGKAEDVFVANALFDAAILPRHDVGYWCWGYRAIGEPLSNGGAYIGDDAVITVHLSDWQKTPSFRKEWLQDIHERVLRNPTWNRQHKEAPRADVL